MSELRWWIAALVAWLFALYNLERLHEPINIASFVYPFTASVVIALVVFRGLCRRPWFWTVAALLTAFFAIKAWLGYEILGSHLPLTITEIVAVGITLLIARQIVARIGRLEQAATETMVMQLVDQAAPPDENGEDEIYREVRRARRFARPLAVVTLSPTVASVRQSLNRFLEEFQRDALKKYVNGRIADLLSRQIRDCDIVAQHNGHFVLVLPETGRDAADEIVQRIVATAEESLGLNLHVGLASFPDQEITFAGLLERAEAEMNSEQFGLVGQH